MFNMRKYEILGFFIIILISICLAIIFWLLPSNFIVDGLGPTNNSLWQIGKLMFISILVYTFIEYFVFGHDFHNFTFAKSATMFIAPIIYIGLSYIVDLGLGGASFNNHLLTYATAVATGQYISYFILRDGFYFRLMNGYAILGILLMLALYIGYGRTTDSFSSLIFKDMDGYQTHIRYLP